MAFKMVTDSEKAAIRIAGTAGAHADLITEEQTERWRDRLPAGQEVIDLHQFQLLHAGELRELRRELIEKEARHLDRLADIHEARKRRDEATPELRDVLYRVRDLVEILYGPKGSRALFLAKPSVPTDPLPLQRVGRIVVGNLEDPDFEQIDPKFTGFTLTPDEVAGEIKKPLVALETALNDLEELAPLANASLEEKHRAHEAVDRKNGDLARFLEAFYVLTGHEVLAAKVRPSSHRKQSENTAGVEGQEVPEADSATGDVVEIKEPMPETAVAEPGTSPRPTVAARESGSPGPEPGSVLPWAAARSAPPDPGADREIGSSAVRNPDPVPDRQRLAASSV
ncbi:MAG: hypothetical protein GY719_06825 [bacterium]|nr:hypothetical protein [bacterium]